MGNKHGGLPGFVVYCIAIISIEEADRLTYVGTPPSLRVDPTAFERGKKRLSTT